MRIVVFETDSRAADGVIEALAARGHQIERCHDRKGSSFPCLGLRSRSSCPLEGKVDAAVVVRARPWPRPAPSEQGVVCMLRAGVPLLVCGNLGLNPYAALADAIVEGTLGVSEACESFRPAEDLLARS